jgi:hypothetical protein
MRVWVIFLKKRVGEKKTRNEGKDPYLSKNQK